MIERLYVSYHEFGGLLDELVGRLDGSYACVYGPPRGGLPIAVHLSHRLGIPLLAGEHDLAPAGALNDTRLLIVDDIADTGRSLASLTASLDSHGVSLVTACLFYKPRSIIEPDIWIRRVDDDCWVTFPWERADEIPNRELGGSSGR